MQNRFGLLDTNMMPIFMIIALDIVITLHFSINYMAVICSPTVIIPFLREASSETYGAPIFHHISFWSIILVSYLLSFAIFYFLFHKPKIPKILLYHLSISIRSHFANNHEGIDNPFVALVASWCLFVHVFGGLSRCLLLDWYLGSQNRGKYLRYYCCITLSSSRKTNASSRHSKKDFWHRCWRLTPSQVKIWSPDNWPISGAVVGEIYTKPRHTKYPS